MCTLQRVKEKVQFVMNSHIAKGKDSSGVD